MGELRPTPIHILMQSFQSLAVLSCSESVRWCLVSSGYTRRRRGVKLDV